MSFYCLQNLLETIFWHLTKFYLSHYFQFLQVIISANQQ